MLNGYSQLLPPCCPCMKWTSTLVHHSIRWLVDLFLTVELTWAPSFFWLYLTKPLWFFIIYWFCMQRRFQELDIRPPPRNSHGAGGRVQGFFENVSTRFNEGVHNLFNMFGRWWLPPACDLLITKPTVTNWPTFFDLMPLTSYCFDSTFQSKKHGEHGWLRAFVFDVTILDHCFWQDYATTNCLCIWAEWIFILRQSINQNLFSDYFLLLFCWLVCRICCQRICFVVLVFFFFIPR